MLYVYILVSKDRVELVNLIIKYVHRSCKILENLMLPSSCIALSTDSSPTVGAVLGRPAPLRLVAVLGDSVAGRLRVGAGRLGLAASGLHVTASGLD